MSISKMIYWQILKIAIVLEQSRETYYYRDALDILSPHIFMSRIETWKLMAGLLVDEQTAYRQITTGNHRQPLRVLADSDATLFIPLNAKYDCVGQSWQLAVARQSRDMICGAIWYVIK